MVRARQHGLDRDKSNSPAFLEKVSISEDSFSGESSSQKRLCPLSHPERSEFVVFWQAGWYHGEFLRP